MCHVPDHIYPTPISIAVHYVSSHVNTSIRMCRQLGGRWSSRDLTIGPCHFFQRRAVGALGVHVDGPSPPNAAFLSPNILCKCHLFFLLWGPSGSARLT